MSYFHGIGKSHRQKRKQLIRLRAWPDAYLVGLATCLIEAGVEGAIATLWPVEDDSTTLLMCRFYFLWLLDRLRPAEAPCEAQ